MLYDVELYDVNGQAWLKGGDGKFRNVFFPHPSHTFRTILTAFDVGKLGHACVVAFEKDDPKFKDGSIAMKLIAERNFYYREYGNCIVVWFCRREPSVQMFLDS